MEVFFDMCSFNLGAKSDLLRKPSTVNITDANYVKALDRPCTGDHDHTPTEGQNTKPAGQYTADFGREHGLPTWQINERNFVGKTLDTHYIEGSAGISFPPNVSKPRALALRRVHQNMGHPSNRDLSRHRKLAKRRSGESRIAATLPDMQTVPRVFGTCILSCPPPGRRSSCTVQRITLSKPVSLLLLLLLLLLHQIVAHHLVQRRGQPGVGIATTPIKEAPKSHPGKPQRRPWSRTPPKRTRHHCRRTARGKWLNATR